MKMINKKEDRLHQLEAEVSALKSFVIGAAGTDKEGQYKPAFVRRLWQKSHEKAIGEIKSKKDFLQIIDANDEAALQ